jgi:two-component system NtrC family response regulator
METILIVDDEKNYLVVLDALLAPEGYEIVTADNAPDALRLVREADLDLVITDMKMPGMNGMELLEECKRIKPELPVIMMTAYGTIEMAVEAMKKHAYDYITKPFQNEQLKLTVRKALENLPGVKTVAVSALSGTALIKGDGSCSINRPAAESLVRRAGYDVRK